MTNFVCIAVPYWLGKKDEYTGSVELVRSAGLHQAFDAPWIEITPDFERYGDPVVAVNRALAEVIDVHADRVPIIFAGDCTSCLGTMKGLTPRGPHVLWLDAHGDFNTPETTPSGFLGGMPLAAMVGLGNQTLVREIGLEPVDSARVTLTDGRDLDPGEADLVRASNMTHLRDVTDLKHVTWEGAPLYIHFDTDLINTDEMPAVSYPADGGPTVEATITSVQHAMRESTVVGILFTLWNNALAGAERSQKNTLRIIQALMEATAAAK